MLREMPYTQWSSPQSASQLNRNIHHQLLGDESISNLYLVEAGMENTQHCHQFFQGAIVEAVPKIVPPEGQHLGSALPRLMIFVGFEVSPWLTHPLTTSTCACVCVCLRFLCTLLVGWVLYVAWPQLFKVHLTIGKIVCSSAWFASNCALSSRLKCRLANCQTGLLQTQSDWWQSGAPSYKLDNQPFISFITGNDPSYTHQLH